MAPRVLRNRTGTKDVDNEKVGIYKVFDRELSERDIQYIIMAVFFAMVTLVVIWRGAADVSHEEGHNGTENMTGFSNQTLPPIPTVSIEGSCTCPSSENVLVRGHPLRDAPLGQAQQENMTPYQLEDCIKDAYEMLSMMQDGVLLSYANTLTKRPVNSPAPQHLYYSWNQKKRLCSFYFDCSGVQMCSATNIATGIVKVPKKKKQQQNQK